MTQDASVAFTSSTTKVLTSASDEGVFTIQINRPQVRNCVDRDTAEALRAAFQHFNDDPGLKVAVLSGTEGNFCAGADLRTVGDPDAQLELDPTGGGDGPMGPSRMALAKPVLAAVEGFAVAGGLELALMADMRIVSQTATFGVFCRRWGVPLIDGGTVRLPQIVGLGRAMDMILTGRAVEAQEAAEMGLANRVVPAGEALAAAQRLATDLTRFPQACMRADRASAYASFGRSFADALRHEGAAGAPIVAAEGAAGADRFAAGAGRHGSFTPESE